MPICSLELDSSSYMVNGVRFDVPERYTVVEPVGQGTYGLVVAAQDDVSGEHVAIKKIENSFDHFTFAKRTLRELRILRHLRHENLIDVREIFLFGDKQEFEDIYVISELMETDLATILKSSQPLSDDHNQFFFYQLLRGMKYVHSAGVIHRDLKPRNLLVNANCDLKIADFGLARVGFSHQEFKTCPMTEYVCTRWYRAPEVLCSWVDYTKSIDIWSIGCIFAEMIGRRPLFPGCTTQNQLEIIVEFLGTPQSEELKKIPNDKCRSFIQGLPQSPGRDFAEFFVAAPPNTIDLLFDMLQFDPDERITVAQALQYPYLERLRCPDDEPVRGPLDTSDFEFERRKVTISALREELFLEALQYYPELREQYLNEQHCLGQEGHDIFKYRLLVPGEPQYDDDEEEEQGVGGAA